MPCDFTIIDYMSGLTGFVLDDSVYRRIAVDRGVLGVDLPERMTEKQRDLILADILFTVWMAPNDLASFQHQHGQFSMSIGKQTVNKDDVYNMMVRLYRKWDDPKLGLIPDSNLTWQF